MRVLAQNEYIRKFGFGWVRPDRAISSFHCECCLLRVWLCRCDMICIHDEHHISCLQNIRRGGYIAAIVGLCMCPWNLLKSSNNFTSYLSAYSVFLSSIAGVMVSRSLILRSALMSDVVRSRNITSFARDITKLLICTRREETAGTGIRAG